jgi:hypothetical protein
LNASYLGWAHFIAPLHAVEQESSRPQEGGEDGVLGGARTSGGQLPRRGDEIDEESHAEAQLSNWFETRPPLFDRFD